MIDIAAVRADTPASANLIHFNNAGASLMPEPVYPAFASLRPVLPIALAPSDSSTSTMTGIAPAARTAVPVAM